MVAIDLADYEAGSSYDGHYGRDLAKLQDRLARIQTAHIVHKRRAIVLFEGWDAAGKGGAIRRLTAEWDPRWFEVWPIAAPTELEREHHFLWRFWQRLPANGNIAVFDRSWYGRVAVERVEGFATATEVEAAYPDINVFEAQQQAHGTTLVKLFVHVTQAEQDRRFAERLDDPWKRWKTGADDYRNRAKRDAYSDAYAAMFARTDTGGCPWTVINGNNKKAARVAILRTVADRLEAAVPMEPPPLDPAVRKLAAKAIGQSEIGAKSA